MKSHKTPSWYKAPWRRPRRGLRFGVRRAPGLIYDPEQDDWVLARNAAGKVIEGDPAASLPAATEETTTSIGTADEVKAADEARQDVVGATSEARTTNDEGMINKVRLTRPVRSEGETKATDDEVPQTKKGPANRGASNTKVKRLIKMLQIDMHDQQVILSTCFICKAELRPARVLEHPCGTKFCRNCVTKYLRSSISIRPFPQPNCIEPYCAYSGESGFVDAWAEELLLPHECARYQRLVSEATDVQERKAIYCHDTLCRRYIPHHERNETAKTARCSCKNRTCMICKRKAHPGETCEQSRARVDPAVEEAERQTLATLTDMGVRFCYYCHCPSEEPEDQPNTLR